MVRPFLLALLASLVPAPSAAQTLAVTHARAWIGSAAEPVPDATILIRDGKIVSVQTGGAVPPGVQTLDAKGRPVTRGLVNAATQIGLTEVSSAQDTRDTASASDRFGASFDVSYALNGNSALIALARADGVTRALSYPSPSQVPPFSGLASMIRLRDGVDILDRPQAAMFVVIGGGSWESKLGSRAAQWQLLRESLIEARDGAAPVATGEQPLLSRRDAAAIRQVLSGAIPLAIVTDRESDIRQAISLARDFPIRVVIVGGAQAWRAADALAAADIPVIVDPQHNLPTTFDEVGARQDNAAILAAAGVRIAFGMVGGKLGYNYNAGLALREGAGIAVANGLSYAEALRAITTNPMAIWGRGRADATQAGADGDLVVWDGDPFEPSTNAIAVIVEGRLTSTENRQTELLRRYMRPPQP